MKTEKKQVHFLSDVFAAVVSSDLKFLFSVHRNKQGGVKVCWTNSGKKVTVFKR